VTRNTTACHLANDIPHDEGHCMLQESPRTSTLAGAWHTDVPSNSQLANCCAVMMATTCSGLSNLKSSKQAKRQTSAQQLFAATQQGHTRADIDILAKLLQLVQTAISLQDEAESTWLTQPNELCKRSCSEKAKSLCISTAVIDSSLAPSHTTI